MHKPSPVHKPKRRLAAHAWAYALGSSLDLGLCLRPLQTVRTKLVCIFQIIGKGRSSLLPTTPCPSWYARGVYVIGKGRSSLLGSVARPKGTSQRSWCDVTETASPVTKALSNFTILSYRDVDTSVLPLFTSKALFVAGKGRFGFT